MTTIAHETGACKAGAIIEAQVIRDSYLYLCGMYNGSGMSCPYGSIQSLISHAFSPSYLTTTAESQLGYAKEAYNYVFEQGNAFYPVKLFSAHGWRLTSAEASLGYKEAIVINTHYDRGDTVSWINDPTYTHGVMLTSTIMSTGGAKADQRNNSVPSSSYTDSDKYSDTGSGGGNNGGGGSSGSSGSSGGSSGGGEVKVEPEKEAQCATIFSAWCDDAKDDGEQTIKDIITFVISILTIGIVVLGTIGIIICGYLIMTARENEAQVTKAKRRMVEIVIGIIAWALLATVIQMLMPSADISSIGGWLPILKLFSGI